MTAGSMADLAGQLVKALQPDNADNPANLDASVRRVVARLKADTHGGMRKEWRDVRGSLRGLAKTARMRVQDDVAAAYDKVVVTLEEQRKRGGSVWDESLVLQTSNIPQHVQLLLNLAQPTTEKSREFAAEYLSRTTDPAQSDLLLYHEIMDEPFEGDHWGPGYDEEVREGWTDSDESDGSSTPSEDVISTPAAKATRPRPHESTREAEARRRAEEDERLLLAKLRLEELTAKAYWKTKGKEVETRHGLHGWRALSSVPAMASPALTSLPKARAISASQLQREILFALTGRPGVMFTFSPEGLCTVVPSHLEVETFTPTALHGILQAVAARSTQVATLRAFVTQALTPVASSSSRQPPPRSETCEAFAEACREILNDLGSWVAGLESAFMGSGMVTSSIVTGSISTPLLVELELSRRFGDVLDYLVDLIQLASSAGDLLDAIYRALSAPTALAARPALVKVFIQAATPIWRLLGDWLVGGMPIPASLLANNDSLELHDLDDERPLPAEFFIQRDFDSAWSDEDFWEAGFVVAPSGWPTWLEGAADAVLEGGKARGLLRSLLIDDQESGEWKPLAQVINPDTQDIPHALLEYLGPFCAESQSLLDRVLEWDCDIKHHLEVIDTLTLMRHSVLMEDWAYWLFAQMRSGKPWADFQILTQSLRDCIEEQGEVEINAQVVRERTTRRQGKATLADIRVDYLVPFPLSQLFTATSMDLRSDVFTFLLRVLKARKALLETRLLVETRSKDQLEEVARIRVVRHALSWVLNTIWIWVNDVIEILAARHQQQLGGGGLSFHAMINLELEHVRRLRRFCFLHAETSSALEVVDVLLALADDVHRLATATSVAQAPTSVPPRPPRSRRRLRRQNSVWDDSDDDDPATQPLAAPPTPTRPQSLDQISRSLRAAVRRLRADVDELAGQGEGRDMWGMLAFALEDWKDL